MALPRLWSCHDNRFAMIIVLPRLWFCHDNRFAHLNAQHTISKITSSNARHSLSNFASAITCHSLSNFALAIARHMFSNFASLIARHYTRKAPCTKQRALTFLLLIHHINCDIIYNIRLQYFSSHCQLSSHS